MQSSRQVVIFPMLNHQKVSGANIMGKKWTEDRKTELFESRIGTTQILVDAMKASKNPPKVFICASAVGIYPPDSSGKCIRSELLRSQRNLMRALLQKETILPANCVMIGSRLPQKLPPSQGPPSQGLASSLDREELSSKCSCHLRFILLRFFVTR
jgi:hypothetical protein